MKYILILVLYWTEPAVYSVEFNNEVACLYAAAELSAEIGERNTSKWVCVPKGRGE